MIYVHISIFLYYFLTGANLKSKRKVTWTVQDIPFLDMPSIKQAKVSKHIDLDTPPHMLIKPATCSNEGGEHLIRTTGNVILSYG